MHILQRKNGYAKALFYQYLDGERIIRGDVRWKPLVVTTTKLNNDGASKSNGMTGCGGLVRDHMVLGG